MRKYGWVIVGTAFVLAAAGTGSAVAAATTSSKIVPFTASYAGIANVTVADGVSTISANGAGKGTPIGVSKVSGTGTGTADSTQTCQQFNGTGAITGLKGAKINFKMTGAQACGDSEGDTFSVSGRAVVTSGAGAYKTAKGSLKVTGVYKRSAKTFAIKFNGKLTV